MQLASSEDPISSLVLILLPPFLFYHPPPDFRFALTYHLDNIIASYLVSLYPALPITGKYDVPKNLLFAPNWSLTQDGKKQGFFGERWNRGGGAGDALPPMTVPVITLQHPTAKAHPRCCHWYLPGEGGWADAESTGLWDAKEGSVPPSSVAYDPF